MEPFRPDTPRTFSAARTTRLWWPAWPAGRERPVACPCVGRRGFLRSSSRADRRESSRQPTPRPPVPRGRALPPPCTGAVDRCPPVRTARRRRGKCPTRGWARTRPVSTTPGSGPRAGRHPRSCAAQWGRLPRWRAWSSRPLAGLTCAHACPARTRERRPQSPQHAHPTERSALAHPLHAGWAARAD